jgi:hypothetical protein
MYVHYISVQMCTNTIIKSTASHHRLPPKSHSTAVTLPGYPAGITSHCRAYYRYSDARTAWSGDVDPSHAQKTRPRVALLRSYLSKMMMAPKAIIYPAQRLAVMEHCRCQQSIRARHGASCSYSRARWPVADRDHAHAYAPAHAHAHATQNHEHLQAAVSLWKRPY